MAKTVSEFLVERLTAWGIKRIFGYPGDGINGIMGALNKADNNPGNNLQVLIFMLFVYFHSFWM